LTVDVSRLPRAEIQLGSSLYRLHRTGLGAWYFSGDGAGRFDPSDTPDRGACYLAEDPLGAWVETFRTVMTIAEQDAARRALATIEIDRTFVVADLTDRRALQAGVTASLATSHDYDESNRLADQLQGRLDGIRWRLRHDPRQELIGVALFGPAGLQADSDWPPTTSERAPLSLIREAEDNFGYRVVPTR
jgi:RES domain-containing protein